MRKTNRFKILSGLMFAGILTAGCQNTTINNSNVAATNANAPKANTNSTSSTNSMNGNTVSSNPASAAIETREPEQYQANVTLKLETMGEKSMSLPPLTAQVARNGADRRMELNLPGGEKVVYLDRADKRFLISPNRKQYAELNKESVGFDVRQMMTPGQIVERVKSLKGVERVGEEQFNGRAAVKYRLSATTATKSQAGDVNTESFVLVDKETGLPLRTETVSQSQTGDVKGINSMRLVTEMSDIKTTTAPDLFAEPKDYKQVAPEELRGQLNSLMGAAGAILGQMMQNQPSQNAPTAVNNPIVSPTP